VALIGGAPIPINTFLTAEFSEIFLSNFCDTIEKASVILKSFRYTENDFLGSEKAEML
jgi:hypothetical protein